MPFVDVQHRTEPREWSRWFDTEDEADRYVRHMIVEREYYAEKRRGYYWERTPTRFRNPELKVHL